MIFMTGNEAKNIIKVLSTAYLYRKKEIMPTQGEISDEMKRREHWLDQMLKKYPGSAREAFVVAAQEIYNDPPEDFKVSKSIRGD